MLEWPQGFSTSGYVGEGGWRGGGSGDGGLRGAGAITEVVLALDRWKERVALDGAIAARF